MKAVIYARFSSEKQNEASIEGQLRECMDYANFNNIEVIGNYIDRAQSAKTDNRPATATILPTIKTYSKRTVCALSPPKRASRRVQTAFCLNLSSKGRITKMDSQ